MGGLFFGEAGAIQQGRRWARLHAGGHVELVSALALIGHALSQLAVHQHRFMGQLQPHGACVGIFQAHGTCGGGDRRHVKAVLAHLHPVAAGAAGIGGDRHRVTEFTDHAPDVNVIRRCRLGNGHHCG